MTKYFIHIGLHKTASTYLQQTYYKKFQNTSVFNYHLQFELLGRQKIHDNIIISNEGLSGSPWNNSWLKGISNEHCWLLSFIQAVLNLKKLYPEAEIIVVFRKHGDLLISLYKQYIQEGGILKFDQFYCETGVIKPKDLNYLIRLNFLGQHFGKIHILDFEKFKKYGDNYLDVFFESIGLEVLKKNKYKNTKSNLSISGKKIELLRLTNKLYPKLPKLVRKICERNKFTPRYVFQYRLKNWKTKDKKFLLEAKHKINKEFELDWKEINQISFNLPNE